MVVEWPAELTEDLKDILGRPNFQCISLAECLRRSGHQIDRRAEDEQAAVIFWLLGFYLDDPINWRTNAKAALKAIEVANIEKKVQESKKDS